MAVARAAIVSQEGDDTLVRIPGKIALPDGPILVREESELGELILSSEQRPRVSRSPEDFFAFRSSLLQDEHWEHFMAERPLNTVRRKPFPFGEE